MPTFTDHLYRTISLADIPQRIISLVPSQTELLIDIGATQQLVGVSNYCIHPKKITKKLKKIGGTKDFDLKKIDLLAPDLIIANKEENTKELIEALEKEYPVWISDVNDLPSALDMIRKIGLLVGHTTEALELAKHIRKNFIDYTEKHSLSVRPKVVYLIWNEPIMVAGQGTFIDELLRLAGFDNIVQKPRYPQLALKDIYQLQPDYLFLSSEPYPFKERHAKEFKELFPATNIKIVDGELFSWYGSRLKYSVAYFEQLQKEIKRENLV